jgi:hypothetical protein
MEIKLGIGMVQPGCQNCFAPEAFFEFFFLVGVYMFENQLFNRDKAIKPRILGLINDPHSTATYFGNNVILSEIVSHSSVQFENEFSAPELDSVSREYLLSFRQDLPI